MNESIKKFFKENGLQVTLQTATAIIFLLNFFLTTKLAPLAQNIDSLITRVSAIEARLPVYEQDHTDIQVVKQQISDIKENVGEIKDDVKFIRDTLTR